MLRVFFGSPGAGKTTLAVKMARRNLKHYDYCYCNFKTNIPDVCECDLQQLGMWTFPEYSYIAIDEAGIEYNSRKFKSLPQYTIEWYKLHRHFACDVDVFSQSWEDMDITLRRLATELWYIKKIGPFTLSRRVFKRVTVNKETEQIIDGYRKASVLSMLCPILGNWHITFRPLYYQYFDSWSHPDLPVRTFLPSSISNENGEEEGACVSGVARRVPKQRPALLDMLKSISKKMKQKVLKILSIIVEK